ncbi:radical SAM protein [Streptomyces sp. NPDC005951]|uniref:radical SAM protein n=1 Tax=Streptomyces sp. NPDC005951 TaxID=3154573 RepID=UPI0033C023B5
MTDQLVRGDRNPATAETTSLPPVSGLLVAVDERCDLGCKFCLRADVGRSALDLPTYARALSRCKELGATSVCLTGGEPTDHPDFTELVRVAVQFGYACSVVTAAREGRRLDALASVAGLLSHVTVSADSLGAQRVGATERTITGSAAVFDALGHGRASLHVTVWELEDADLEAMAAIDTAFGVEFELSPLLLTDHQLKKATPEAVRSRYAGDLAALRDRFGLSDRFTDALAALDRSLAGTLDRTCSSDRLYLSPRGALRRCPYDRENEVDVRLSRRAVADGVRALHASPSAVGSRCALLCGE